MPNIITVTVDGQPQPNSYTSLKRACGDFNVPYFTASRGKRKFIINDQLIVITLTNLVKIKGRNSKFNNT